MSSNNQFRGSPPNPYKKAKANDPKSEQKLMSDAKDPPKFLAAINPYKKPNIINEKPNTIINPCKKVPTHAVNTDSLFSKSVGAVTNRKKLH